MKKSNTVWIPVDVRSLEGGNFEAYWTENEQLKMQASSREEAIKSLENLLGLHFNQNSPPEETVQILLGVKPTTEERMRLEYDHAIQDAWDDAVKHQWPVAWAELYRTKDGRVVWRQLEPLRVISAPATPPTAAEGAMLVVAISDATCAPGFGQPAIRGIEAARYFLPKPPPSPSDPEEIERLNLVSLLADTEENLEIARLVQDSWHDSQSDGLVDIYSDEYHERMLRSIAESATSDELPERNSLKEARQNQSPPPLFWAANRLEEAAEFFQLWLESSARGEKPLITQGIWLGMQMQKAKCEFLTSPNNEGLLISSRAAKLARQTSATKKTPPHLERLREAITRVLSSSPGLKTKAVMLQLEQQGVIKLSDRLSTKGKSEPDKFDILKVDRRAFEKTLRKQTIVNEINEARVPKIDRKGKKHRPLTRKSNFFGARVVSGSADCRHPKTVGILGRHETTA